MRVCVCRQPFPLSNPSYPKIPKNYLRTQHPSPPPPKNWISAKFGPPTSFRKVKIEKINSSTLNIARHNADKHSCLCTKWNPHINPDHFGDEYISILSTSIYIWSKDTHPKGENNTIKSRKWYEMIGLENLFTRLKVYLHGTTVGEVHAILPFSRGSDNSDCILQWWSMGKYLFKYK